MYLDYFIGRLLGYKIILQFFFYLQVNTVVNKNASYRNALPYQRNENKGINRNNNLELDTATCTLKKKAPTKYISSTPDIVI